MAEKATVARPYAKAAFAYAREQGKLDQWSGWLGTARMSVSSEEYRAFERSPSVTTRHLVELLKGVLGDALDEHGREFVDLLAENDRLDYLPEIAERFEELKAEDLNVADVEVISAVEIDEAQRERLALALRARLRRDVRLHCTVDPSLIGGAVVRSGDMLIDGSLRNQLERLGTELTTG